MQLLRNICTFSKIKKNPIYLGCGTLIKGNDSIDIDVFFTYYIHDLIVSSRMYPCMTSVLQNCDYLLPTLIPLFAQGIGHTLSHSHETRILA